MLIVIAGMVACEAPAPKETIDMDEVRSEIQSMEDAYAEAANANDAEAIAAYFADDAVRLPPNQPMIKGKEDIIANLKENVADDDGGTIKFEIVDLYAAGDYAVEIGSWVSTDTAGTETTGKYMSLFEKQEDGQYKCIRDIWNANEKYDNSEDSDEEAEAEDEGEE